MTLSNCGAETEAGWKVGICEWIVKSMKYVQMGVRTNAYKCSRKYAEESRRTIVM